MKYIFFMWITKIVWLYLFACLKVSWLWALNRKNIFDVLNLWHKIRKTYHSYSQPHGNESLSKGEHTLQLSRLSVQQPASSASIRYSSQQTLQASATAASKLCKHPLQPPSKLCKHPLQQPASSASIRYSSQQALQASATAASKLYKHQLQQPASSASIRLRWAWHDD